MLQNHMITGYVISRIIPNPLISIPLSIASHYFLDLTTYPSKEMEIALQDDLKTLRDKITIYFVMSFLVLTSIIILILVIKNPKTTYISYLCMIAANLPDLPGQIIPLIRGKRGTIKYNHTHQIVHDPYLKMTINQVYTLLGIFYLFFA